MPPKEMIHYGTPEEMIHYGRRCKLFVIFKKTAIRIFYDTLYIVILLMVQKPYLWKSVAALRKISISLGTA